MKLQLKLTVDLGNYKLITHSHVGPKHAEMSRIILALSKL